MRSEEEKANSKCQRVFAFPSRSLPYLFDFDLAAAPVGMIRGFPQVKVCTHFNQLSGDTALITFLPRKQIIVAYSCIQHIHKIPLSPLWFFRDIHLSAHEGPHYSAGVC